MKDNVLIKAHERGKLVEQREGHNVWVDAGHAYLAAMLNYSSFPTGERSDRLRYLGLGIGGIGQSDPSADASPFTDSYPAGFDPNATNGHKYDRMYPINPLISTLERPIRVSGGTNPYASADPGDQWLVTNTFPTHPSTTSAAVHAIIDASAGDVLGAGSYPYMPLSEIGLYTYAAFLNDPFNPGLLAYFSFGTITLNPDTVIEIIWSVRF